MKWRWSRIEGEWLAEWLELLPRPWPDSAGLGWLRHAVGHAERGQAYWVPSWVSGQVSAAAASGELPGRRALASVAGWGEKKARLVLDARAWVDQISTRAKGPGNGESSALDGGQGAPRKETEPGRGPGYSESSAFVHGARAQDQHQNQEHSGRGPGRASFSALAVHQGAQVGASAAALDVADPTPASSTQGPSRGPPVDHQGPSRGPPVEAQSALFRGSGAQQGPASWESGAQQGPDRARDNRARRPAPAATSPPPGDPSLFVSPRGETGSAAGGVLRGTGRTQVAVAATAILARARCYEPGLPERPDRALLRLAGEHDPEALCRVIDWAARAPDPEARRIREARREGVSGSWGPAYVLADNWVLDRIARANAWDAAGRPLAADAQLPAEEQRALAEAERARLVAEDQRRWPGWAPPSTWQGLPREYVELDQQGRHAERMIADGGDSAILGRAILQQAIEAGWDPSHPSPRRGA